MIYKKVNISDINPFNNFERIIQWYLNNKLPFKEYSFANIHFLIYFYFVTYRRMKKKNWFENWPFLATYHVNATRFFYEKFDVEIRRYWLNYNPISRVNLKLVNKSCRTGIRLNHTRHQSGSTKLCYIQV